MLRSIAYVSRANEGLDAFATGSIFNRSRHFNTKLRVTGLLLLKDKNFFQVFEGPAGGVQQVFDRIKASPYHCDIKILADGLIKTRLFPEWAMGGSDEMYARWLSILEKRIALSKEGFTEGQLSLLPIIKRWDFSEELLDAK